jgi:glycosyltransferase involved in cell wall biosynthesis
MRLLICAIDFAPKIGGEETYLLLLAGGLAGRFSGTGSARIKGEPDSVIVATRTGADGFDDTTLPFPVVRRPGIAKLWRLLGEADIVQLSGPLLLPLLLGLLRGKPVVITHHMYHSVCPSGSLLYEPAGSLCSGYFAARRYHECLRCVAASSGWGKSLLMVLATFLRRWLCKRAAVNVGVTQHVSRRIALPNTETVYIGVPDPLATDSRIPNEHPGSSTGNFAYVGRLAKEKGLCLLLEAIKRLRDQGYNCRLKLIGDGPEGAHLAAKAASLSLQDQVHFAGYLQGQALHTATADVTAVIMPSVCEETAGVAAMEQMMRGGLVIASDVGGLGEVVDSTGFKFRVGDVIGLTNCLRRAIDKPVLAIETGRKARERALKLFGKDRMVNEHEKLYEKLLFQKRPNHC